MAEHPNEALVRRGYQAFLEGDTDALVQIMSPGVVARVPGDNLVSGVYEGREAVLGRYGRLYELSGGTVRVELEDVRADGADRVVVSHRVTAERNGRRLDARDHITFTIADGQVVAIDEATDDEAAKDAFWS